LGMYLVQLHMLTEVKNNFNFAIFNIKIPNSCLFLIMFQAIG